MVLCPQVSWIRRTDYHLLTVGLATYSSDDRFFTAHVHNTQVKELINHVIGPLILAPLAPAFSTV
jgi:hypothetical protein